MMMGDPSEDHNESDITEEGPLDCLIGILENPERRILPLLQQQPTAFDNEEIEGSNSNEGSSTLRNLVEILKKLFREIESLGGQYETLLTTRQKKLKDNSAEQNENENVPRNDALSGLSEMFVSPDIALNDSNLPEIIYGQVDLQNTALTKLVRKSTKRLSKSTHKICVLDMSLMGDNSESENQSENGSDQEEDGSEDEGGLAVARQNVESENDGDEDEDEEESEEARRIRERMERAMDDMDDEDEDELPINDNAGPSKMDTTSAEIEDLYDPVVEDMKDGFFDLNEMEDFADEEENYLPDEDFGQPENKESQKKTKSKKSFHQRQRDGELDDDAESDDEDNDFDDLYEEVKDVKRKQYREQEDIDALYSLYQDEDSNDGGAADAADMTAADFFGAPKKKYIDRYKKKHPRSPRVNPPTNDDDDSWGDYDFEKENQTGWGDEIGMDTDETADDESEVDLGIDDNKGNTTSKNVSGSQPTKSKQKLHRQTEELEKELLAERPWQMTGETKSTSRPVNSLLEATPEFEMASKQAPTITVEHTMNLEDIIKSRVLAEDWDDVVPRELPDIGWNKKRGETPEVSQEKSKLGLGELYEREYLKKAVGFDKDAAEKQTEEDKVKDEMRQLFANLCSKLDALSNYHFAPRPIAEEAEVRPVTTPAIAMEEVLPLHVSDARGVAPEEVYATKRGREGLLRADSEMDQNERKRQRQSKKSARRKARKEKQADEKLISRLQPGLGLNNPYEKRKAREELEMARSRGKVVDGEHDSESKFSASGTFFKRLQAEAQQTIHSSTNDYDESAGKKQKSKSSAFKL